MAGEENNVSVVGVLSHALLYLIRACGVETRQRLVQHPHLGIVYQGGNNHDFLLHSVGIAFYFLVYCIHKIEHAHIFVYALFPVLFGHEIQIRDVIYIFPSSELLVNGMVVRNIADVQLGFERLLGYIVAAYLYRAGGNRLNSHQRLYRGAFARTVVPQKAVNLSALDFKAQVVYRLDAAAAVNFGKMLYAYHIFSLRIEWLISRSSVQKLLQLFFPLPPLCKNTVQHIMMIRHLVHAFVNPPEQENKNNKADVHRYPIHVIYLKSQFPDIECPYKIVFPACGKRHVFYQIVAVHEKIVYRRIVVDKPGVEYARHEKISRKHGNAVADVLYFGTGKNSQRNGKYGYDHE